MLALPTKGFAPSAKKHNVRIDCLCEWIEGCVTFEQDRISQTDIIDMLIEGNLYTDQNFAKQRVDDAFTELARRGRCLGQNCPFSIHPRHVNRTKSWEDSPAYAFCLLVSLQVFYRAAFNEAFGADFTEQGACLSA